MSNTTSKVKVLTLYVFSESKTLTLSVEGNNYKLYLLDAEKGKVGTEIFSITNYSSAIDSFNIRKNCIKPELKSSYIKKIRKY